MSDLEDSPAPGQDPDPFNSQAETLFDGPLGAPFCPDKEPTEAPPERIGHYRIERPLGHGGMGEVFLAWDEILERRVAIKRIRRGSAQSGDQRERFHREAKAAGRLSHSSIVQIHELILDRDAIVMEYVHGSTLAERLETGPLPVRESLRLAREIAEGLAAAHAANLIHRDLKAENVIITPQGQAKILDFGLVKPMAVDLQDEAEALTRKGVLLGTYHSMSPEQASGGQIDERSDLFSLGVLLYEMLSGVAPFRGDNPLDTLKRVIADTPPPLPSLRADIPPAVGKLVDRLLAKKREERPQSAEEVIQELRDLEARLDRSGAPSVGETATADGAAEARRSGRHSQRSTSTGGMSISRRLYGMAGGVIVLLTVAKVGMIVHDRPNGKQLVASPTPKISRPIRVVVLQPEVKGETKDRRLLLTASGIQTFSQETLTSLEGLTPVDPSQILHTDRTPTEIIRAGAADEAITGTVEPDGEQTLVTLHRIQCKDSRILWSKSFQVRSGSSDFRLLRTTVATQLKQAYPGNKPRPGTPDLEARDQDYAEFLAIKRDRDGGNINLAADLARLEKVLRGSPHFVEAQILAARVSLYLYRMEGDPHMLEKTQKLISEASSSASGEPRVLSLKFQSYLEQGNLKEAEDTLTALDRLPEDPDITALHASLAEKKGRFDEAIKDLRTAVQLAPTWQNLYSLASLEARTGHVREARGDFKTILEQSPGNAWAREGLARIEMFYGDLNSARTIFAELAQSSGESRDLIQLGFIDFLFRNNGKAAATYRRALKNKPGRLDGMITLNLADAEEEMNQHGKAKTDYKRALRFLARRRDVLRTPSGRMAMAQCLAQLGQSSEAVKLVQEILLQDSGDPLLLFDAALVETLVGDHFSAFNHAKAALEKGLQPSWFNAYGCFRADPKIQSLLKAPR